MNAVFGDRKSLRTPAAAHIAKFYANSAPGRNHGIVHSIAVGLDGNVHDIRGRPRRGINRHIAKRHGTVKLAGDGLDADRTSQKDYSPIYIPHCQTNDDGCRNRCKPVCQELLLPAQDVHGEAAALRDEVATLAEKMALGDMVNMVFSGTAVSAGKGVAVVTSTGMQTQIGKIATLLERTEDEQTPLQRKLAGLGKVLGGLTIAVAIIVFVVGILTGKEWGEMLLTAVSLAVAAIPEGLPAVVTISLALGIQRMIRRNALIRKLPSVETLGSTSVICSDKTGTLTQGEPKIVSILPLAGDRSEVLKFAGSIEQVSEHPLARAVVEKAKEE
ncbi:MAG: ATPase, P-type (Transporting), HAD superfamily, subfamily IC, partial [Candidatus Gottesmanbacteria bacterium GW2011_GWA2_47_9]